MKKAMTCVFFLSVSLLVSMDLKGSDTAGILGLLAVVSCFPTLALLMECAQRVLLPDYSPAKAKVKQMQKEYAHR